jgi:hypothetical protein
MRITSQVGETLYLKSPARRGESNSSFGKRSDDPEDKLKAMKGISAEPVKWYSTHRPRLSPENTMERDRKRRKRNDLQRAVMNSQVAEKVTPLKPLRRQEKPESVNVQHRMVMDQIEHRGRKHHTMHELRDKGKVWDDQDKVSPFSVVRDLSPKVEGRNDDEIVMMVKLRRNVLTDSQQAYVDFPFTEKRGESGPFKMGVTLDQLLNYYYQLKTDFDSSSSDSDDNGDEMDKDEESSSSDDDDSGHDGDGLPDSGVSKDTIPDEEKDKRSSPRNESVDRSPKPADNDMDPGSSSVVESVAEPVDNIDKFNHLFHVDQIVYYWDLTRRDHWVGVVRAVRIAHPAEGGDAVVRYWIEPEGEGNYRLPCLLVHEKDIRSLDLELWNRAKWSTKKPICLPIHDSPLLPLNCVGIDTCSALSVSSERSDFPFLPRRIQRSKAIHIVERDRGRAVVSRGKRSNADISI